MGLFTVLVATPFHSVVFLWVTSLLDPISTSQHCMPPKRSRSAAGLDEHCDRPKRGYRERQWPSDEVLAAREAQQWKWNRERQQCYCDRQHCLINRRPSPENNTVGGTADPDTQPDAYLAPHQQLAIAAFFERINFFRSWLLKCSTCKEKYHGMRTNSSQCERCLNEVLWFSFHCSFHLLLKSILSLLFSAKDIILMTKTKLIQVKSHSNCVRT